jgi:hypothetical protein
LNVVVVAVDKCVTDFCNILDGEDNGLNVGEGAVGGVLVCLMLVLYFVLIGLPVVVAAAADDNCFVSYFDIGDVGMAIVDAADVFVDVNNCAITTAAVGLTINLSAVGEIDVGAVVVGTVNDSDAIVNISAVGVDVFVVVFVDTDSVDIAAVFVVVADEDVCGLVGIVPVIAVGIHPVDVVRSVRSFSVI